MEKENITYTYVWSINKHMVVARSLKQAIDIYCVKYDAMETDISCINRVESWDSALALINVAKENEAEEAQP